MIDNDGNWKQIVSFGGVTFGIKNDGKLYRWGIGLSAIEDTTSYLTPKQVGSDSDWKSIDTNGFTTVAIKEDGTLWGWGYNIDNVLQQSLTLTPTETMPRKP